MNKHCRTICPFSCCYCWENNHFPAELKNSTTILIHEKGNTDDLSNFRPITLEPILSRVMTSNIRNKIFAFVVENNYVETNTQRGFWSNISGTIEHTELLTNILKNYQQQQLVVSLFDLKNFFGDVHHNLIKTRHIPPSIINPINSLYSDYFIPILLPIRLKSIAVFYRETVSHH